MMSFKFKAPLYIPFKNYFFSRLEEIAPSLDLDVVEVEGEDKYVDREYVSAKLGLEGYKRRKLHLSIGI
ncbi:MAG: hypothetical protein QW231_04685 [Candidatus Bathyarchaeia archaeon]